MKAFWYFITAKFYRFKAFIFLQLLHAASFFNEDAKKLYLIGKYKYEHNR